MTALEEIKKALAEATLYPGPWEVGELIKRRPYSDAWELQNATDLFGYIYCGHEEPEDVKHVVEYIAAVNPAAISELLSTLESLQRENEELRKDKDHIAAEKTGIAKNSHNNVDYWKSQAEAAEAEVKRLETELALSKPLYSRRQIEARVKALEAALKPFAEYMGDHFDKDNHGNPLPDDLGVGWIYLTHADFRRARTALASTGGEHNAE